MTRSVPRNGAAFYCPMTAKLLRWLVVATRQAVKPPLHPVSARKNRFGRGLARVGPLLFLFNNNLDAA